MLYPFCGITKEMMSRGPQVEDMDCRETTFLIQTFYMLHPGITQESNEMLICK
jgi:hypothetical protein